MKVGVHIAHWQRVHLFGIILDNLRRVEQRLEHELVISVAGPDCPTSLQLARRYDARYAIVPNDPLGAKVNAAVGQLRDCDCLIGIGSDDLICARTMRALLAPMDSFEMAGIIDIYLYDVARRELVYWPGYQCERRRGETIGPGRCVRAEVMERLGWAPFEPALNANLDRSMFERLEAVDYSICAGRLTDFDGMIIDVKTSTNINPMDKVRRYAEGLVTVPADRAVSMMSFHFGADVVDNLHEQHEIGL